MTITVKCNLQTVNDKILQIISLNFLYIRHIHGLSFLFSFYILDEKCTECEKQTHLYAESIIPVEMCTHALLFIS